MDGVHAGATPEEQAPRPVARKEKDPSEPCPAAPARPSSLMGPWVDRPSWEGRVLDPPPPSSSCPFGRYGDPKDPARRQLAFGGFQFYLVEGPERTGVAKTNFKSVAEKVKIFSIRLQTLLLLPAQ